MKIEGPKSTNATGKTEKAKKAGGTSGASFSEFLTETEEAGATSAPAPVAGVSLFMALQAAEAATDQEQRRRAVNHADELLDELEDLRLGLLLGTYTTSQLQNLASRVRQQRLQISDPALLSLLDDIELRASVELAKYE